MTVRTPLQGERELIRQQAIEWNDNWSYTDRKTLESEWDRLGAVRFVVVPSKGYFTCWNAESFRLMEVHPGYLKYNAGFGPEHLDVDQYRCHYLSTFKPHQHGEPEKEYDAPTCPVCTANHPGEC